MGSKYREYSSKHTISREERDRIHPIWRGIGFGMIVLIPIVSYAAAIVVLQQNDIHHWFPIPWDLLMRPGDFLYNYIPDGMLYIKLLLIAAFIFVFYSIFTFVAVLVNRTFGVADRMDPYYVPPVRRLPRRR